MDKRDNTSIGKDYEIYRGNLSGRFTRFDIEREKELVQSFKQQIPGLSVFNFVPCDLNRLHGAVRGELEEEYTYFLHPDTFDLLNLIVNYRTTDYDLLRDSIKSMIATTSESPEFIYENGMRFLNEELGILDKIKEQAKIYSINEYIEIRPNEVLKNTQAFNKLRVDEENVNISFGLTKAGYTSVNSEEDWMIYCHCEELLEGDSDVIRLDELGDKLKGNGMDWREKLELALNLLHKNPKVSPYIESKEEYMNRTIGDFIEQGLSYPSSPKVLLYSNKHVADVYSNKELINTIKERGYEVYSLNDKTFDVIREMFNKDTPLFGSLDSEDKLAFGRAKKFLNQIGLWGQISRSVVQKGNLSDLDPKEYLRTTLADQGRGEAKDSDVNAALANYILYLGEEIENIPEQMGTLEDRVETKNPESKLDRKTMILKALALASREDPISNTVFLDSLDNISRNMGNIHIRSLEADGFVVSYGATKGKKIQITDDGLYQLVKQLD